MDLKTPSPFYLRFGLTMVSIAILATALYLGRSIFMPFFSSILLASLLLPVTKFLQRKRLTKVLSITVTLIAAITVIGIIVYFLSTQLGSFLDDIPALEKRFKQLLWTAQKWIQEHFNIGIRRQN